MNSNILESAIDLVRKKKKVEFSLNNCTIEQLPYTNIGLSYPRNIKLDITVMTDHISWTEYTDLEYVIFENDLSDNSAVDKVIGGDLSKYNIKDRQILRLAFIIYNGIKYGIDREQRIDYIEKGWHPRVTNVRMRF